jgi:hypothetical protein
VQRISARVSSAEEYLRNLIEIELGNYGKGIWIGIVRSALTDM